MVGIVGTGTVPFLGFDRAAEAKKRRKKRCKPRKVRVTCQTNKQCCTKKTGRVCASNAKEAGCNLTSTVCCLPLGSFGCTDDCDCCGGDTGCDLDVDRCASKL